MNLVDQTVKGAIEDTVILRTLSEAEMLQARAALAKASRIFVYGAGRSGLMLKAFAMRMINLGHTCYVVSETITPAIESGDLLVCASASGKTASTRLMLQRARSFGAATLLITGKHGKVNELVDHVIRLDVDTPKSAMTSTSVQMGGSSFEQCLLILTDTLASSLHKFTLEEANRFMLGRQANLE